MDMHDGQLAVSPGMVRELVDQQFPRWRGLAIAAVDAPGTVNAIFRVGDQLAARFPQTHPARHTRLTQTTATRAESPIPHRIRRSARRCQPIIPLPR